MAVRTDCIQPDGSIVGAKQAITHYQVLDDERFYPPALSAGNRG